MRKIAAIFAIVFTMVIGAALPAQAAYVTHDWYWGARWQTTTICVDDRTGTGFSTLVPHVVKDFNDNTILNVVRQTGRYACDKYPQEVVLVKSYYGKTGWVGRLVWPNLVWGKTPKGNSTWLFKSPTTVQLNLSYYNSYTGWDHVVTHELGHALGALTHPKGTCNSVMSQVAGCTWRSYLTTLDRQAINSIYSQ